jgi:hypothetical protein
VRGVTDEQKIIATWVHDLTTRIQRAQLRFEFIGLDPDEQDQLQHEKAELLRLCTVLDRLKEAT